MAAQSREMSNSFLSGASCRATIITLGLLIFLGFSTGAKLQAQITDLTLQQRQLNEPFRLRMDQEIPTSKRALFNWGGWLRSSFWAVDENVDRDFVFSKWAADENVDQNFEDSGAGYHALRLQQLRLWGNLNLDQAHQFYARAKLDYFDWNHGTSYDLNDGDWNGPNLERGWYNFRLSQAQYANGEDPTDFDLSLKIGRQYVELGAGLALSIPLDAIQISGYWGNWQLTGLGALSIPSTYNIDRSVPGDGKESRRFWGTQLRYHGWRDHEPFAYYFGQKDQDFGLVVDDQTFGYDSQYLGLGSRGQLLLRDLQYTCEVTGEFGQSHADSFDQAEQEKIQAWAFDSELRYLFQDAHFSQLALEYLLASGDSNRWFSPTNTLGGNQPHSTDTSFSGWGFRGTGMVLAPRMSNLQMVRLGASTFPANHLEIFKNLELAANFFLYHKQQGSGAASDNLSINDNNNKFLGSEFDIHVNWRITSDLAWTLRYGFFVPGDAFLSRDERQLFFTGFTLGF